MNTARARRRILSDLALEFLNFYCEQKKYLRHEIPTAMKYFEHWMHQKDMKLSEVKKTDIEQFERVLFESGLGLSSRNSIRISLQRYFTWLHNKQLVHTTPKDIFPRMGKTHVREKVILPNEALQFLTVIEIQLKGVSTHGYKAALRGFHHFLQENNLDLKEVKKNDMNKFLILLAKKDISNSTRRAILIQLRSYFRWLHESEIILFHADELIKHNDIPKKEVRLPRPLPQEVDKEIQERLRASSSIMHKGLIVMRRTGIRIGELTALKYDCLKTDINGYSFLKVELGKLYTERMVPLHEDTVILIKKIQEETSLNCDNPDKLIYLEDGRKPVVREFMLAFNDVTFGFNTVKPIVSHQLRHTFACEMLNCGMSLIILKEILGHKDIKMTLQYASVTQGTIRTEYIKAYSLIAKQYELPSLQTVAKYCPEQSLEEVISYLKKSSPADLEGQKKFNLISRRLCRIKSELSDTEI